MDRIWVILCTMIGRKRESAAIEKLTGLLKEAPFSETLSSFGQDSRRIVLEYKKSGLSILFEEEICTVISAYLLPHEGYSSFPKELPDGLPHNPTREDVRGALGPPGQTGGGKDDKILGYINTWERFNLPKYDVHVEYYKSLHVYKYSIIESGR